MTQKSKVAVIWSRKKSGYFENWFNSKLPRFMPDNNDENQKASASIRS